MLQDLLSDRRAHLRGHELPNIDVISEETQPVSPVNSAIIDQDKIQLSWSPSPGADRYLLQVAANEDFSTGARIYDVEVKGTTWTITSLIPNKNYYWRVRPYNAYRTCTNFSNIGSFRTGDNITTHFTEVIQNPIFTDQPIRLNYRGAITSVGKISLYNSGGQLVKKLGTIRFEREVQQKEIDYGELASGLYFLSIETSSRVINHKIVISRP
jgi:hypothetical protein